ncbi:hypothetical protein LY78DRAFT_705441 [Colletotrichum sublineola]|nr:hypothetical protein LY78DRAFT_705441 [Colletotrichum sublineola]
MYVEPSTVDECCAAIRGERIPQDINNSIVTRSSLIRGIRLHFGFATSDEVTKLCHHDAQLARARNARLIMSGEIPDTMTPEQQPYCIWHPQLAPEQTYRNLFQRHPEMRYQVGRACAAAGYNVLYQELDLLPDTAIAEEARESQTAGGQLIYDSLMSSPHRYSVIDDDDLTIQMGNPLSPAYLNGDTLVRLQLFGRYISPARFAKLPIPDIEEDMHINDKHSPTEWDPKLYEEEKKLLYQPLPLDLPTVKKNTLTCFAAFEGNIDRYVRLSNPKRDMGHVHALAIVRGIYHNTMSARWWAEEIAQNTPRVQAIVSKSDPLHSPLSMIKMAISARRILINDPREFAEHGWPTDVPEPYHIWWPLRPNKDTLELLAKKVPSMTEQVAVAAIYCDEQLLYRMLNPKPHWRLYLAAQQSHNTFYAKDLEKRAAEQGISLDDGTSMDPDCKALTLDMEPSCSHDFYGGIKLGR